MKLIEFYKILIHMKIDLPYELNMHIKYITKYENCCLGENGFMSFSKSTQISLTDNDIKQIVTIMFQNQYRIQVSYITPYDEQYINNYLISIYYNKRSRLMFLVETKYSQCSKIWLMLDRENKILL